MSVVILMSGGIDSAVMALLAYREGIDLLPLFVDYGQLASESEWAAVRRITSDHGLPTAERMDLSGYGATIPSGITDRALDATDDAFLPGRNALLLLAGGSYAFSMGASTVAIGLLDERGALFPDQTSRFVSELEVALGTGLAWSVHIATPLITMSKREIVELARSIGLDMESTYSCHLGDQPCGRCISCRERESGFADQEDV